MVGKSETTEVLNNTLLSVIKLLNGNDISEWFICYGTLLGIVRENNCIDKDDDVDIIIHKSHYNKVKNILIENNFKIEHRWVGNSKNIIKTVSEPGKYASVDIYMADFKDTSVFDLWNRLTITDCFIDSSKLFLKREWQGETVYLPNNYVKILNNRYGDSWKIKKNIKVPQSMTTL